MPMQLQGLKAAVMQQLRRGGWAPLRTASSQQQLLFSDYLAAAPGAVVTAPRIEVDLTLEAPSRLFLMLQNGEPGVSCMHQLQYCTQAWLLRLRRDAICYSKAVQPQCSSYRIWSACFSLGCSCAVACRDSRLSMLAADTVRYRRLDLAPYLQKRFSSEVSAFPARQTFPNKCGAWHI